MVETFLTRADDPQFKAWMTHHAHGFYLNERNTGNIRRGTGEMILHRVGCSHLGMGEGVISPTYGKAAADDRAALRTWATQHGLTVVACRSCKPD